MTRGEKVLVGFWIAICFVWFLINCLHGIIYFEMPYDETIYRIFSRNILRNGWPVLPDGSIANVNPPLAYYLNALGMSLVGDNLRSMRALHLFVYFIPILLITMRMSNKLFGGAARWVVLVLFSGLSFVYYEILTVEIDMPFTLISTLLMWLTMERHELVQNRQPTVMLDRAIGIALCIALLMKFVQGIIFAPIFLTILAIEYKDRGIEALKSLGRFVGFAAIAPLLWMVWYGLFGAHLGVTLLHLFHSVILGDANSASSSSLNNNPFSYALFVVIYISIPLFAAVGTTLLWHRQSLRSLTIPLVWIGWFLVAMGMSKIQAVRYFNPALPATILLASGIASERILRSCEGLRNVWSWLVALITLVLMFAMAIFLDRQPLLFGHRVEMFKFVFFGIFPVLLALSFIPKLRQFSSTLLVLILIGSTFLFSGNEFPLFKIKPSSWYRAEREQRIGLQLKNLISGESILATSSMTVIYYLDRNYLDLPLPLNEDYLRLFEKTRPTYVLLDFNQLNSSYAGKVLQAKLKTEYRSVQTFSDQYQLYKRL